jgi:VCBS repeat protein
VRSHQATSTRTATATWSVSNSDTKAVDILLGQANGLFTAGGSYAAGPSHGMLAVGDFNGDRAKDVAVANFVQPGTVTVLLGNGDGSLQPPVNYRAGRFPYGVTAGDFNDDGRADIAVANFYSKSVSVFLGKGDGSFNPKKDYAAGSFPHAVAVGDFDRDGKPDLVVANTTAFTASVLRGNGDGSFGAPQSYFACADPWSLRVADFNNDLFPDVVVANAVTPGAATILLNDGNWPPAPAPGARFPDSPWPASPLVGLEQQRPALVTPAPASTFLESSPAARTEEPTATAGDSEALSYDRPLPRHQAPIALSEWLADLIVEAQPVSPL